MATEHHISRIVRKQFFVGTDTDSLGGLVVVGWLGVAGGGVTCFLKNSVFWASPDLGTIRNEAHIFRTHV